MAILAASKLGIRIAIKVLSPFFYALGVRVVSVVHYVPIDQHVGCCFNDVQWGNEPFAG